MTEPAPKIVIAEDDKIIRDMLFEMLKSAGYDPFPAENGIDAIEAVIQGQVSLVITDINMPKMDGLEAIVVLREISPDLPIIILSIWEENEYQKLAEEQDINDYGKKPFNVADLMERIEKAIPSQFTAKV